MTTPDHEPGTATPGVSRRDALKRGAVLGGALVWATPVVQSVTHPAFAQTGTPAPDDEVNISWAALTFANPNNAGTFLGFKYNIDDGELEAAGGQTPCCQEPDNWGLAGDGRGFVAAISESGNCLVIQFDGLADGTVVNYAAMNAGGDTDSAYFEQTSNGCGNSSSDDVLCAKGALTVADGSIDLCDDA